jgi:sugar phosphate permease
MRIFAALLLAYILSIFYRSFLSVIADQVMADLAIGPTELGVVSAAWFVGFAVMQFPVGWALDRIGPRVTVCALMGVGVAGAALFALAPNAWVAAIAMALIGVGCSPVFMAALYLFARGAAPDDFAASATFFVGVGSIGNLIGAAPLSRAAIAFGWRPSMLALAAAFALALALAAILLRDPPRLDADAREDDGLWAGVRAIMAIPIFWRLAPITCASYAVLLATRGLWIAPYLGEVNGFDHASQGDAALLMAATMTAGAFALGWGERYLGGPKRTVLVSTFAVAALYAALAAFGHVSGALAAALFAAIGFAGFSYALLMAHARLFFPAHLIGRGMTFMNFLFIGGASAVQAASGWLVGAGRAGGLDAATNFAILHGVFAAILLVSVAIYARTPARPPARTEPA